MTSKCCGIKGLFFGHKFEARYSDITKNSSPEVSLKAIEVIDASTERLCAMVTGIKQDHAIRTGGQDKIVEITKGRVEKTYHCDVCTRCGVQVTFDHPVAPTPTRRLDTDI